jgi:hypothetical protein
MQVILKWTICLHQHIVILNYNESFVIKSHIFAVCSCCSECDDKKVRKKKAQDYKYLILLVNTELMKSTIWNIP